jgi:hypothetical protein
VKVTAPPGNFSERFVLELENAPEGITLTNVAPTAGGLELAFACDAEKAKPGASGNLICSVMPKNLAVKTPQKKSGNQAKRAAAATLPAIPFTITAQ